MGRDPEKPGRADSAVRNAAFAESDAQLKAIFACSQDAIGVSKAGVHIFVNPAYVTLFGYGSANEILEKKVFDLIAPGERLRVTEHVRKRAAGEMAPTSYLTTGLRRDGSTFDMDVRVSTYAQPEGNYTVVVLRDITEQRRTGEALRESEERHRLVTELTSDYMVKVLVADDSTISLDLVSGNFEAVTGRTLNEVRGFSSWAGIFDAEDLPAVQRFIARLISTGEAGEMECRTIVRGNTRWIAMVARPHRDPATGRVASITGAVKDISARRQAEAALRESEERFRTIFEHGPMGMVLVSPEFRFISANGAFCRMMGYAEEELRQRTFQDITHPDHIDKDVRHVLRLMSGELDVYRTEKRYVRKDGTMVWGGLTSRVVRDRSGRPRHFISIIEDINDRKKAEEEILRLNVELEQRVIDRTTQLEAVNRELEAFSYSVSHDLRAPLRGIDGFSQALSEDAGDRLGEAGRGHLSRIRAAAQRMGQLIDDMLKLSRVTRMEMLRERVDLSDMARGIVVDLRQSDPGREIAVTIPEGLAADGDPRLLRVIMENLIRNAWKFTTKSVRPMIEVGSSTGADGRVEFFVRDNGAGFDMHYAGKLFGPFQRLHGQHEFPGIGIGLATVQRIVLRHGGAVRAEGDVDKGATFYFTV